MFIIKSHKLSGGGICAALCIVFLFIASYIPAKVVLLIASSIVMGICLLRYKGRVAFCVYAVVTALCIFIIPNKLMAWMYVAVFGIYPLLKFYIEKIKNIVFEYAIKFILWNIHLFLLYIVFSALGQNALYNIATFWFWLLGIFLMLVFDLLYGVFISAFFRTYYKFLK